MKTRCVLVVLAAALAVVFWHVARPARSAEPAVAVAAKPRSKPVAVTRQEVAAPAVHWTRAEAAERLRLYFSKEQLGLELELEQARYRGQYWQAEPGLAELQSIEIRRTDALRRLTSEMNMLLAEMCPNEAGEPLILAPFFGPDHPAPNLAFLSDASRERIEGILLARDPGAAGDPMKAVASLLSDEEWAEYARWNAPPAAALRNRLAGFGASEDEFNAIFEWQAAAGSDGETAARAELAHRLGADRLAQFDRLNDPAVLTAAQDLRRLGLPLADAGWLADFRQRAAAQLQQSWNNPRLSDAQKQVEVAAMQTAFCAELVSQIKPPSETDDLLP